MMLRFSITIVRQAAIMGAAVRGCFRQHVGVVALKKERFSILLVVLFLNAVMQCLFSEYKFGAYMLDGLMLFFFLATIFAISEERKHFYLILSIGLLVLLTIGGKRIPGIARVCDLLEPSLLILFTALVIYTVLNFVFKGKEITRNKIAAALCVYLLLGTGWSAVYSLLETVDPGSLVSSRDETIVKDEDLGKREDFNYFSFVTLTTLGYGDITPVTRPARTLAMLEAIVGQLYLAVLIARLVGLHTAHARSSMKDR
jgi:hypothetical protein